MSDSLPFAIALFAGGLDATAAQVATLGDVYRHKPEYMELYCSTLVPALLQLVPACWSAAADSAVLHILSTLFARGHYPAPPVHETNCWNLAATLGQVLGRAQQQTSLKITALRLAVGLLTGSGSGGQAFETATDADGSIASYKWTKISGPALKYLI